MLAIVSGQVSEETVSLNYASCPAGKQREDEGFGCEPCSPGTYRSDEIAMRETPCSKCADGSISSNDLRSCHRCPDRSVPPTTNATANAICRCKTGFMLVEADFADDMKRLESYYGDKFSHEVNMSDFGGGFYAQCIACPPGANCAQVGTERATARPEKDYVPSDSNLLFQRCFNDKACARVSEDLSGDPCDADAGYTGPLCSKCRERFRRTGNALLCERCSPNQGLSVLLAVVVALVGVLAVAGLAYQSRKTAHDPGTLHGILLKLFMNSVQLLAMAASFDFRWTPAVETMLDGLTVASSASDSIIAVDCLLPDPNDAVYFKAVAFLLLPLILCGCLFAGWKLQCRLVNDNCPQSFRRKLISSCIVVFCGIYASVSRSALMLLKCTPHGLDRTPYLFLDQEVRCWSAAHTPLLHPCPLLQPARQSQSLPSR